MRTPSAALALALLLGAGCTSADDAEAGACAAFGGAAGEGVPYEGGSHPVAFCYPEGWERMDGAAGSVVSVLAPGGAGDPFRANVNLYAEPLSGPMTAAQYAQASVQRAPSLLPEFHLLQSGSMEFAGGDGHVLEYTATVGDLPLHFDQALGVRGTTAYVLTYTAAPEEASLHQAEWQAIVTSFHYTE